MLFPFPLQRLEAAREICWQPASCADLLEEVACARASNAASGTLVPTTFVDDAELVWRLRGEFSLKAIADAFGAECGEGQVKHYSALSQICSDAWQVIVTTFRPSSFSATNGDVTTEVTPVTSPFTENLLRVILDLTPHQQLLLCTTLAHGKDSKGHKYTKSDFRTEAQRYDALNALEAHAAAAGGHAAHDGAVPALQCRGAGGAADCG